MIDITAQDIQETTLINSSAKQWAIDNLDYLNKPMQFFGSSTKLEKGSDKYDSYVMYLQPADKVAAQTICAFAAKAGCKEPCLIDSGQLGMSTGQNAATKRTILMLLRPDYFKKQVLAEIDKAERRAAKPGQLPALFRLNGTSDLDFSDIINQRPDSMFYDYSKILSHVRKNTTANYDLTFSGSMYSKQSRAALHKAVAAGHRIAMAFNTKLIASDSLTIPDNLADFDKTDLRHLDGPVIGALTRKGSNKKQRAFDDKQQYSFFVTSANLKQFKDIIQTVEVA
ncbi:hypothetical protein OAE69_04600 [Gammaproteobacteria bacterium]|mgnify:CR=1 FL=1|nr:hypothetical protein [Gammaproteobacteria bacterium]